MTDDSAIERLIDASDGPRFILVERDGRAHEEQHLEAPMLLPGSFNPLHHGHEQLAEATAELRGRETILEIAVVNVDKPPLSAGEVRRRLAQFHGQWRVVLSRAPTFLEKGRLFPGATFVLGWDTAVRIVEPRYYGGQAEMLAALGELRDLGCRFLVGGRTIEGRFRTLDEIAMEADVRALFEAIPEARFRADVSSTEIRAANGG